MANPIDPPAHRLARPLTAYEEAVRFLSNRLVEAQRPIRVLDAIKWDESVERGFFAAGGREPPPVTAGYYARRPLPFDPDAKRREFRDLETDIRLRLGGRDITGRILGRMCAEYRAVIDLLAARGTPGFGKWSRELYGCTENLPAELELLLALAAAAPRATPLVPPRQFDALQAVAELSIRLERYFRDPAAVRVKLADGIQADAAAGGDYLKVRRDARFTEADLRLLEVHEGWVHLGTSLNGQRQPVCTFLSKGPPSATRTQEGLAVLTEFLAGVEHPSRIRRLRRRLEGLALAEQGADFRDVYRAFLEWGDSPPEGYQQAARIFRGSLPVGGGPFTKDLCYVDGLAQTYRFVRSALRQNRAAAVALLFCGKTALEDMEAIQELVADGVVRPPQFLPPPYAEAVPLTRRMDELAGMRPPVADPGSPAAPWAIPVACVS